MKAIVTIALALFSIASLATADEGMPPGAQGLPVPQGRTAGPPPGAQGLPFPQGRIAPGMPVPQGRPVGIKPESKDHACLYAARTAAEKAALDLVEYARSCSVDEAKAEDLNHSYRVTVSCGADQHEFSVTTAPTDKGCLSKRVRPIKTAE